MGSIRLDGVSVEFDGKQVLQVDTLELTQSTIAVIGANGSGKSSFVRLLNGLVKPASGTVTVNDIDVAANPKQAIRQAGFIFSNPDAQIVMPTVIEDVEFSLRDHPASKEERHALAMAALTKVGLDGMADARAQQLSSGQKQLLAIAAVAVREPRLVIADEPTALLDAGNARLVAKLVLAPIAEQVVIVTHDMALARMCEVVVEFESGRLVAIGEPAEITNAYSERFK